MSTDLVGQTQSAFDFIGKLYFETSYLIKEVEARKKMMESLNVPLSERFSDTYVPLSQRFSASESLNFRITGDLPSLKKCPFCRCFVNDEAVCEKCGYVLIDRCPYCGRIVEEEVVCEECGFLLKGRNRIE